MKQLLFCLILTGILPLFALTGKICFTGQQDLNDQWTYTLAKRPKHIRFRKSVMRNEKVCLAVLAGEIAEKNGQVKLSLAGKLISPSGKISAWNTPAVEKPFIRNGLSFQLWDTIDFRFEPKDEFGIYQAEITLTDENSGKKCILKTSVELTEKSLPQTDPPGKEISPLKKMEYFYIRQDTALVVPALKQLVMETIPKLTSTQSRKLNPLPVLSFFYEVLKEEKQLWPELTKTAVSLEGDAQKYVLFLIGCLGSDAVKTLPVELRKKVRLTEKNPFELKVPSVPWQIELFWSRFFATGQREPLLTVIWAVSLMKNGMTPEVFRTIKQPTDRDRTALAAYVTGRAALLTLKKNSLKHPRVYWYLESLLAGNSIRDPFTRAMIDQLVQELAHRELGLKSRHDQEKRNGRH